MQSNAATEKKIRQPSDREVELFAFANYCSFTTAMKLLLQVQIPPKA